MLHRVPERRGRFALLLALGVAVLTGLGLLRAAASRSAQAPAASHDMAGMNMSDDAMVRLYNARLASHPGHGGVPAGVQSTLAVRDSFLTVGLRWDEDHNTATVVDTAHIGVGDAIRFKWGAALHSATSGTGSGDPQSGVLFNHDMSSAADNFDFQFNTPGTYPFYCTFHEASNMRGVIIVTGPDAAPPGPIGSRMGFVAAPWPNPTRSGATFRIALASAGQTRLDVLDAQGRRVASLLDRDLPAGAFTAHWDGTGSGGRPAPAGVYMIRLRGPGLNESRRVAIER